jgi:hypothetical protein
MAPGCPSAGAAEISRLNALGGPLRAPNRFEPARVIRALYADARSVVGAAGPESAGMKAKASVRSWRDPNPHQRAQAGKEPSSVNGERHGGQRESGPCHNC